MMSINPDAHSTNEIDLTHWGVEMARKGGVPADRVINAIGLQEFTSWAQTTRPPSPVAASKWLRPTWPTYAAYP